MLKESFEQIIQHLCEDVLSERNPECLPEKIIDHVQKTFPVQWSTLWLTEQKETPSEKRLRLAAAGGVAKKLLTAENGGPVVYDFGEGLTGEIAQQAQTINITCYEDFKKYHHAKKYDSVMYGTSNAENECRCVLGVPLMVKLTAQANSPDKQARQVIGVLKLENIEQSAEHPEAYFTPQDVKIVEAYAAVVAVALVKAQMRADSIRTGAGLLEVSRSLLAGLGDAQEVSNLEQIVQQTAEVISAEACSLWLRSGLELRLKAAYGYSYHGNIDQIPPYRLPSKTDGIAETVAKGSTEKLGLTLYVARSGKSLNLQTADEIYNYPEWRGEQAKIMWANKAQYKPCYSLVEIPLIDDETQDVRGVFKIENKRPTLFQLESFFTKEDEQLLTILGNSISFSLITSERIERLRRLGKLVGDVRVLDNLDEALFFILTGLTHRDGLQYDRAMICLVEEKPVEEGKPKRLICQFAIGVIEKPDWEEVLRRKGDEPFLDLDKQMEDFRTNKAKYLANPMMSRWKGRQIDIADPDQAIAQHTAAFCSGSLDELNNLSKQILDITDTKMLSLFAQGDFVLIPITVEKELKGIIYADNRFTGNRVNRFECAILDVFAGMAGAVIQASGVPGKLKAERDEAWRTFSRPAAHRLGTEASIIQSEAELYIKPELERVMRNPNDGRIGIQDEVITNSLKVIRQAVSRLRLAVKDYQRPAFDVEEPVEFDLCDLVEQTINNTIYGLKGIKVLPLYRDKPLWVCAARGGITYVFEELLINAWKEVQFEYHEELETSDKRTEIQVGIEFSRDQNSAVCIVSDNGSGIPGVLIKDIFQKPMSGRGGGTGLGLYIVKQILDQNHAKIELLTTNKPTGFNGACFKITIPLSPSQCLPQSARGITQPPEILVVEDNPILRKHLSKVLTENKFTYELVKNENEAVDRLSSTLRTIVADINLSEAGGSLTGGILLATKLEARKIPIILISADPWYYLPDKNSQQFEKMQLMLSIYSVIDRNSPTFYKDLVNALNKIIKR
ncbi:MAG: GAF domain-containing protein [Candidatus Methylumidiphilus sp.]